MSLQPQAIFIPTSLLPIPLPGFRMAMVWHTRLGDDRGLAWLRQTLLPVARNDL